MQNFTLDSSCIFQVDFHFGDWLCGIKDTLPLPEHDIPVIFIIMAQVINSWVHVVDQLPIRYHEICH